MKLVQFAVLFTVLGFVLCSTLAFADSAATVRPIPFKEFKKIAGERSVAIDAATKKIILKFADSIDPQPPQVAQVVKALEEDSEEISLEVLMPMLEPERGQVVSEQMAKHDDPLVRFVSNLILAGSGNSEAARSVHALIHDESLVLMDKRLIRTWANGIGIRANADDPTAIFDHLTTAMGEKNKLKKGDAAPKFRVKTTNGRVLSSDDLKEKVVVLHFWSTWCAPCMARMPSHINALEKYDLDAVAVVYVSLDEDKDAYDAAVTKHNIPFETVCEFAGWGGELTRAFGVNSVPFDIVIGRDGMVFSNSIEDIDDALAQQ